MDLEALRLQFGRSMAAKAGEPEDGTIAHAFASVQREGFVGSPPWLLFGANEERGRVTSDPSDLYEDVLVQLKPSATINNGQPSLHALCFSALKIRPDETVVHVGTGTGYYTTMLALLCGAGGSVDGYEIDRQLAAQCANNLRSLPWVKVHASSGTEAQLPPCDVLYVNAGATDPLRTWLDALRMGGRLLFPLTPNEGYGGMLLIVRRTGGHSARFLCGAKFIDCAGARNERSARQLQFCFHRGGMDRVRSLRLNSEPDASQWCSGGNWWLSTDETPS